MNFERLHNKVYLKRDLSRKTKESFKFLKKILKNKISLKRRYKLIDVGCASGELLLFLSNNFKNIDFYGADNDKNLISLAKKKSKKKIKFKKIDYTKKIINEKFDIIICSGVISIFDRIDIFFKNLKKNMHKNSVLFLFSNFNEYDYDVFIKYKKSNQNLLFNSGLNVWSLKTIRNIFKKKKLIIHPFYIRKNISKNKKNILRSWTLLINKKRYFTNALTVLQKQSWLEIRDR